jgi:GT2 family glycosyltransferase
LTSLGELDYPKDRISVIVVDNGSVDGSVQHLAARHPSVRVVVNPANLGFSAACNAGAALAADADVVVFLNNDMRVEKGFLRELLTPIEEGNAQCVAAKILSWDGKRIDFAGGGMAFHGIGFQRGYQEAKGAGPAPAAGQDLDGPTLFACGGAMAIVRRVFEEAGGFDEDFFAYYEDADLGWRLWILGHTVRFAPRAVCYHHHAATSRAFPPEQIRMLQVRNPLLTVVKNYGEASVERILAASLLLAANRAVKIGGIDTSAFRIEREGSRPIGGVREVLVRAQRRLGRKTVVSKLAVADLVALADVGALLPKMAVKRARIQAARKRSDAEIAPLFLNPFWCVEPSETFERTQRALEEFFRIRELFRA